MKFKTDFFVRLFDLVEDKKDEEGINQNKQADEMGISHAVLSQYLNGRIPRIDKLVKIAEYYGVSPDYLLGLERKD